MSQTECNGNNARSQNNQYRFKKFSIPTLGIIYFDPTSLGLWSEWKQNSKMAYTSRKADVEEYEVFGKNRYQVLTI